MTRNGKRKKERTKTVEKVIDRDPTRHEYDVRVKRLKQKMMGAKKNIRSSTAGGLRLKLLQDTNTYDYL